MSLQKILLVRHAESVPPGPGFEDEFTRPLSERGLQQAVELAANLHDHQPDELWSSPYLRARQTLVPFSDRAQMPIQTVPEFREHVMAPVPIPHWREVLAAQWSDFSLRPEGGETFTESAERGWRVVENLLARGRPTVALAGHGTTISLILNRLDPSFGLVAHLAMPNPAVYVLEVYSGQIRWSR